MVDSIKINLLPPVVNSRDFSYGALYSYSQRRRALLRDFVDNDNQEEKHSGNVGEKLLWRCWWCFGMGGCFGLMVCCF
jgi:hypothetical protein